MPYLLDRRQLIHTDLETAWKFFSTPRNLDRLTPPDVRFEITHLASEEMHPHQMIHYRIGILPGVTSTWVTEITHVEEQRVFIDEQRVGPYKLWHHRHTFTEVDAGVEMRDEVHYHLPFGPFGKLAHALFVRRKLESIFDYRISAVEKLFPPPLR